MNDFSRGLSVMRRSGLGVSGDGAFLNIKVNRELRVVISKGRIIMSGH
jgi:hypothetical protein